MRCSTRRLRWCGASLVVVLAACGGQDALEPTAVQETPRAPAAIEMVSGDDQQGTAGARLEESFVVRVTDAQGFGIPDAQVSWQVTSGAGELFRLSWPDTARELTEAFTQTALDGTTRVSFRPAVVGTSTVTAEVEGLEGARVTFAVEVTGLLVRWMPAGCADFEQEAAGFYAPDGTSDISVPVGTTVEWRIWTDWWPACGPARIVSTSVPTGGKAFASGRLDGKRSFEFVPGVPGRWEFVDEVSGETGTLTATAVP